jgi:hypothetical protein
MPRLRLKLPAKEARIGSAHERLWNFLPAKGAPEIFVARDRSFIYTGGGD